MNGILDVQQVFAQRVFVVPDYQRGYAWTDGQWRDLREDLTALPTGKDHFTGTLILRQRNGERVRDAKGAAYDVYEVVDGQQRLTTLVILLRTICNSLAAAPGGATLSAGIEDRFLRGAGRDGQPFFKLTLNDDCREHFERNILGVAPGADGARILSHERLSGAKTYFDGWLAAEKKARGAGFHDWLIELHDKVVEQLKFSVYEVSDEAEVGVIFEVMNDRGKPLSELEKVKNFLLYTASKLDLEPVRLPSEVNATWRQMLERLMQAGLGEVDDEDRLLRFHWLALHDPDPKNWNRSRSVKGRYRLLDFAGKHAVLLDRLLWYVRTLGDASVGYCDAYRPSRPGAFGRWKDDPRLPEVKRWSVKLVRLDALAVFVPLLIAARIAKPDDIGGYLDLVKACERYVFRVYRLGDRRADAGRTTLYGYANQLAAGKMDVPGAVSAIRSLADGYCSARQFLDGFGYNPEKDWYNWDGLRYFLYEYEEHLAGGRPVALDWDVLDRRTLGDTIEHILPQTLTAEWAKEFPSDEHWQYLNDLGNLCLTYGNSSYKNKPFKDKKGEAGNGKPSYINSTLRQEQDLAAFDVWNKANVMARRQQLIEWAVKRWGG